MLATGGIAAATANATEEPETDGQVTPVTSVEALKEALEKGGSVEVAKGATIELTEPITISKSATLTGEGTITLADKDAFDKAKGDSKAPITVNAGASLTVDGVTFDGRGVSYGYGNHAGGMLYVAGNLDFESGTVQNVFSSKKDGDYVGAVYIANGGKFTMKDGVLQNNTLWGTPYDAKGAVLVDEGGSFALDGGTLTGNTAAGDYGLSGVVTVNESDDTPGSFTMNGGSISNNKSTAVKVGGNGSGHPAVFNMRGGTISGNVVTQTGTDDADSSTESGSNIFSAGVYVGFGDFKMSGGTISGNTAAYWGGGVVICGPYNGTAFTMTGGTISGNKAAVGGGVFVTHAGSASPNVTLSGGTIVNNEASEQGGGVYVVKGDTVHLENVAIYGNTAKAISKSRTENESESTASGVRAGIGGGVWTCATGNLKVYIDNGGAVFDNAADNAGDDLAFVNHKVGGGTAEFKVSDRMIGGGQVGYYKDGGITAGQEENADGMGASYLGDPDGSDRYNASSPGEAITNEDLNVTDNNYALKSGVTEAAKAAAKGNAKLVIAGNTANRGGGVGANGNVIIGTAPGKQHDEVQLTVNKEWKDEEGQTIDAPQDSVTVALKSGDNLLDTVELSKDNEWSHTFTGLPQLADNAKYTVEETTVPDGFTPSYSETQCDSESGAAAEANDSDDVTDGADDSTKVISCKVTVTNSKEPETPPTPPTPPTPSDTEGDLTIEKKVKGENAPKDREFTFDVTLTDANGKPVNGTYGKVTFTDGKATVTLKAGEKVTMTGIPETYKYTVSERPSDGFVTTTPGNATGTVGDGHVTVTFTNTWTDLTVELDPGKKFLEGRELKAGEFTFELWDGDTLVGTATNTVDASDPHYGSFSFSFAQEANTTKTYVMKERKGDLPNVTYDTREYQVTVATDDKGMTSVTYSPDLEAGGVVFHNVYTEPEPTPTPLPETSKPSQPTLSKTGSAVASLAGAGLLLAAAGAALVTARRRRMQR